MSVLTPGLLLFLCISAPLGGEQVSRENTCVYTPFHIRKLANVLQVLRVWDHQQNMFLYLGILLSGMDKLLGLCHFECNKNPRKMLPTKI